MEERFKERSASFLSCNLYKTLDREYFNVSLRKKKRQEKINEKRKRNHSEISNNLPLIKIDEKFDFDRFYQLFSQVAKSASDQDVENFLDFINGILTKSYPIPLREHLSCIPKITENFGRGIKIKIKASLLICNSAAGSPDIVEEIVRNNGIDLLLASITPSENELLCNILWGLGNLVMDNKNTLEECLQKDIIKRVNRIISECSPNINKQLAESISVLLQSLCVHWHKLHKRYDVEELVDLIMRMITTFNSNNLPNCIIGLSSLCKCEDLIDIFLKKNILDEILKDKSKEGYLKPILSIILSISSSTDTHTKHIVNDSVFDTLFLYIESEDCEILKRILMILANVAATNQQNNRILSGHNIFMAGIKLINHENETIRYEASFLLKNFFAVASDDNKREMIDVGVYCELQPALEKTDPSFLINCLSAVYYILEQGKYIPYYLISFEESGCLESLIKLQKNKEKSISESVEALLSFIDGGMF